MMSSKKFIPAAHFDFLTPFYGPFVSAFYGKHFRKIAKRIDLKPDEKLLDVGCGDGNLLKILHKKYPNNKLIGLDIDPKILKIARKKLSKNIELIESSAASLPPSDHSINVVTSTFMIHHLRTTDKEKMLKEIFRILKPNGRLYLLDFGPPTNLFGKIVTVLFRKAEHLNDALEDKYRKFMKEAGFKKIHTIYRTHGMFELLEAKKQ